VVEGWLTVCSPVQATFPSAPSCFFVAEAVFLFFGDGALEDVVKDGLAGGVNGMLEDGIAVLNRAEGGVDGVGRGG
jgi:hypothetical protein